MGVTAVTVQARTKGMSRLFLTWTASKMSCAAITSSKTVMFRYRLSSDSIRAVPGRLSLVYRNLPKQPEIAQHAAGSEHHRRQRIVGDGNRQAGLFADAFVEILDQSAAAGENNAAVADVGAQ